MGSFIGAALPWVGGKVSDLLGLQREPSDSMAAGDSSEVRRANYAGTVDAAALAGSTTAPGLAEVGAAPASPDHPSRSDQSNHRMTGRRPSRMSGSGGSAGVGDCSSSSSSSNCNSINSRSRSSRLGPVRRVRSKSCDGAASSVSSQGTTARLEGNQRGLDLVAAKGPGAFRLQEKEPVEAPSSYPATVRGGDSAGNAVRLDGGHGIGDRAGGTYDSIGTPGGGYDGGSGQSVCPAAVLPFPGLDGVASGEGDGVGAGSGRTRKRLATDAFGADGYGSCQSPPGNRHKSATRRGSFGLVAAPISACGSVYRAEGGDGGVAFGRRRECSGDFNVAGGGGGRGCAEETGAFGSQRQGSQQFLPHGDGASSEREEVSQDRGGGGGSSGGGRSTSSSACWRVGDGARPWKTPVRQDERRSTAQSRTTHELGADTGGTSKTGFYPSSVTRQRAWEAGQRAQTERLFAPAAPVGSGRGGRWRADLTISNWPPAGASVVGDGGSSGGGGGGGGDGARGRRRTVSGSRSGVVSMRGGAGDGVSSSSSSSSSSSYEVSSASSAPVFSNGVLVPRPFLWAGSKGRSPPLRDERLPNTSNRHWSGTGGRTAPGGASWKDQARAEPRTQASSSSLRTSTQLSPSTDAAGANQSTGALAWRGGGRLLNRPSATLQLRRHALGASSSSSSSSSYPSSAKGLASRADDPRGRGASMMQPNKASAAACLERLDLASADPGAPMPTYPAAATHGNHCFDGGERGNLDGYSGGSAAAGCRGDTRGGCDSSRGRVASGCRKAGSERGAAGAAGEEERPVAEADDTQTISSSALSATSVEEVEEEDESDGDVIYMTSERHDPGYRPFARRGRRDGEDDDDDDDDDDSEFGDSSGAAAVRAQLAAQVAAVKAQQMKGVTENAIDSLKHRQACPTAAGAPGGDRGGGGCGGGGGIGGSGDHDESSLQHPPAGDKKPAKKKGIRRYPLANRKGRRKSAAKRLAAQGADESKVKPAPRPARPRVKAVVEPLVPPQPPPGPRQWPERPASRALVYAAAAQASRRARGFTGWSFPKLPPSPPRPPTPPPPTPLPLAKLELLSGTDEDDDDDDDDDDGDEAVEGGEGCAGTEDEGLGRKSKQLTTDRFLGFAKDNEPGVPSPNEFGWLPLAPMHTPEGRAAIRERALENKRRALEEVMRRKRAELEKKRQELDERKQKLEAIAFQRRQEILDALRIKEEIAEARRKRRLQVLFLGMTRVAEYDAKGGLEKGMKRFDLVERMVRDDVNEANMNPLRDTARVLAMEALGHEVRCISKVSTPGESDNEKSRSTRASGGPTGLGRFLATDITNTGASRGFLRRVEEKWENVTFDTVLLDHYWLPDSVVWLNKGYMANDGGLIQNLVRMTSTRLLSEDFEIMLPINQAFFELLLPHFPDLERHFTVEFLVGERLEHLKKSHLALEADDLIPEDIMQHVYGKEPERQVSHMLGVKQPTAEVAAVLLKYGVAAEHFCCARFLKLSRNPPPHPALAAVALTAASESAKIAEDMAKVAAESAQNAAESAMAMEAAENSFKWSFAQEQQVALSDGSGGGGAEGEAASRAGAEAEAGAGVVAAAAASAASGAETAAPLPSQEHMGKPNESDGGPPASVMSGLNCGGTASSPTSVK